MIKNIFAIFIFSLLFVACSTNELSKQEKEVQRQEVSKELLSDISYILFLLKQKDLDNLNSRFINPKIGLYEVYKSDIENKITFKNYMDLNFNIKKFRKQ